MCAIVIHLSESLSVVEGSEDGNMTARLVLPTGREVYKRFLVWLSTFLLRGSTLLDFLSLVKNTEVFPVLSTLYDL